MFMINKKEFEALQALGARLESRRLARNETQESFAARLGISSPTYRKMVQGDPNVKVGYWVQALSLVDALDDLDRLLPERTSFFRDKDKPIVHKQRRVRRKR
jgi:transcriptional regulator with XRE-family HTH domain